MYLSVLTSLDNWLRSLFGDGGFIYDNVKRSLIFVASMIVITIFISILVNLISRRKIGNSKRAITIRQMLMRFIRIILYLFTIINLLDIWGFDTAVITASLGIFGVAIAFGSQELVKDIISGVFLVLDNRFDIGDVVEINGFRGTVVEIGLKTTKLRNFKNQTLTINNGDIQDNINYFFEETETLTIDIGIAYEHDIDAVDEIINEFVVNVKRKYRSLLQELVYRGITEFGDSAINLSFLATTKSGQAYGFKHQFHKDVKRLFDEAEISIPFNQVVLHESKEEIVERDVVYSKMEIEDLLNVSEVDDYIEEETHVEKQRKIKFPHIRKKKKQVEEENEEEIESLNSVLGNKISDEEIDEFEDFKSKLDFDFDNLPK